MNMGRRFSGILLLVAASFSGWAVAQPRSADLEATSLIRQAESLRANKLPSSIDNRSDLARRSNVFAAAAALEASIDAGAVSLSGDLRNRLSVSLEALQDVPVNVSLSGTRAPLANGTLSGTVSDATTGLPVTIANAVRVQAWDFSSQVSPTGAGIVNSAFINASGQYTLTLPPGNYHVRTTSNTQGFINQAFGFGNCPDNFYCPRYVGTIVTVPDGGAVNNINFQMQPGGRITGTVTRSDTSAPLVSALVAVVNENGQSSPGAATDGTGNYTIGGLVPGRYRVYASPPGSLPGFLGEVHNNIPCSVNDCFGLMPVDWITVTGTGTTTGINFSLDPLAGSISGTVTESGTGLPIQDDGSFTFLVNLRSEDQNTFTSIELGAGGTYAFTGLRPGNYIVSASVPGFIGKIVSSLAPVATSDCVSDACDHLTQGARISVAPSGNVTGLDFQLDRGARVSGTIRSVSGALPIQGATVSLSGPAFASGVTDALGNFTVSGIPAGVYYVNADAPALNYVQTWLGDVPCRGFHCQGTGTPLTVTANAVISGLQINLGTGGTLSGTITDAATGFPAPRQTRLELFDTSNRLIVQSISNGAGGFSFGGLAPGAYKAVFASSSVVGWMDTAFGGLQCPRGGCDQSLLPSVFVTAGATTSGINVTLPRGPRISGRILDATTGQPIVPKAWGSTYSSSVAMNNNLSNYAGFASVDRAGNYLSRTGFPNGPYFVSTFLLRNNTPIGAGYIDELYDDRACPYGSCGLTSGTPVNVAGTDVTGINMNLSPGGGMSGRVTDAGSGNGLAGVTVRAFDVTNRLVAVSATGPTGNYQISGLPAGNYFLTTDNTLGYQDELFNGFSCEPFCNPSTGSAVVVAGTTITPNRDFALERSVTVSGVVTEGVPVANVLVEIYGQIGNFLRTTVSNAAGAFTFTDLAPGRFYIRTRNTTGRVDDLFYNASMPDNTSPTKPDCVGLACQVRRGTPVILASGGSFNSADLQLTPPAVIEGTVRTLAGGTPMSGVTLQLLDNRGAVVASRTTSATGTYVFSGLAGSTYALVSRGTPGFVDLAWPNVACPQSCNGLNGTPIAVVTGGSATGIDLSLSSGGEISGTVRNSATNLPIPGAAVQVYNSSAIPVNQIATNASGNYALGNLADGSYYVRTQNSLGFVNEVFVNRNCGGYCDMLAGDAVAISGGAPVGLVDFSLDAGGSISGRLTNAVSGSGIALAEVQALDVNGLIASRTSTNATGQFTLGGLQPGTYKVRTSNTAGFVNQIYRTPTVLSCSPSPCLLSAGTGISVTGAVSKIDMALSPGGTISGTAADLFNNPLPTGVAILLDSNGIEVMSVTINNGLFEFNGLANGSYYVLIRNSSGLVDLLYPNAPCPAGACNITASGTPIVLSGTRQAGVNSAFASVDLRLPEGREISGQVTRGGLPLAGVTVSIYNASGSVVATGMTDALGRYETTGGLPAGAGISYFAATTSPSTRGAADGSINEAWNNVPCMLNCGVAQVGTAIPLPAAVAPLANINFDLAAGGAVSGRVQSSLGDDLSLVRVELYDAGSKLVGTADTNSLGNYRIDGLAPGTYFARTVNVLGLEDRLFGGGLCVSGCNPLSGSPITVSGTATTNAIDFSLSIPVGLFANGFE